MNADMAMDPTYRTVSRDDFPAMVEVGRYAQRSSDFEEIIARNIGLDAATVHEMYLPGFNPNGLPNQEATLHCYRFFRQLGLVPEPIPEATFAALWGTEVVEEALQEIGRLPES